MRLIRNMMTFVSFTIGIKDKHHGIKKKGRKPKQANAQLTDRSFTVQKPTSYTTMDLNEEMCNIQLVHYLFLPKTF